MLERRIFTPMAEATTDRVRFPLADHLPEWPDENGRSLRNKIGIDVPRIEQLLWLGGINTLTVDASYDGASQTEVEIVGRTQGGEAIAGRARKKTVPLSTSHAEPLLPFNTKLNTTNRWVDVTVHVNMDEVTNAHNETLRKNVRNPKTWARIINKEVKKGIRREGLKNILPSDITAMTHMTIDNVISPSAYFAGLESLNYAISVNGIDIPFSHKIAASLAVVWSHFITMGIDRTEAHKNGIERMHPSLIKGIHIDTAAVLYVASKTSKLAKGLKK